MARRCQDHCINLLRTKFTMAFAPPTFCSAKLTAGSVESSSSSTQESLPVGAAGREWEVGGTLGANDNVPPPSLERTETMSRRILEIQDQEQISGNNPSDNSTIAAFWLQRKLGQPSSSRDVVARLGYRVRPRKGRKRAHNETMTTTEINTEHTQPTASSAWELEKDENGQPILAKVHIVHNSNTGDLQHQEMLLNELGALHKIAQHNDSSGHVMGSNLMAQNPETHTIYAILPHHRDGTLLQFCQSSGSLPEPLARFLFRQILKGLKTLKTAGMCHRNLSLDTIAMDGDHIDIVGLGWALPCDDSNATKTIPREDGVSTTVAPTPGGSDPRFIPPESFASLRSNESIATISSSNDVAWNGFRDDLWAAGLILYSMVVGTDALFASPIVGDQRFKKLCIQGDFQGEAQRFGIQLTDNLVRLLQSMMGADPQHRPTLEQVLEDAWVTNADVSVTPTSFSARLNPNPFAT